MAGLPVFLAGAAVGALAAVAAAALSARRARERHRARMASLAHDLRSPLSSIAAFVEILQDDPELAGRYLGVIHEETARLERIIADRIGSAVPERTAPPVARAASVPGAPALRRVLVVDDDRYIVEATRTLLSQAGFHALGAAGGEEALSRARSERPDLILMDLTMPGLSGDETLQRLRGDPDTRDIPVIITTGDDRAGAPAGAAGVLIKPITRAALLDAVARAIPQGA